MRPSAKPLCGHPGRHALLAVTPALILAGCIHTYHQIDNTIISPPETTAADPVDVASPVKAHLVDGAVVVYRSGARVATDAVHGTGIWYDALRRDSAVAEDPIPMSSVLGLESYSLSTNSARSAVVSVAATTGMTILTLAGIVAISCIGDPKCFGSCPTVYTMAESGEVLEAELFSYSVAPLLEGRDVDLLGAAADEAGIVTLEIRNEALESHYINHLELLEVGHAVGEAVVPDERGRPLVVGQLTQASARDRYGRNVTAQLEANDAILFSTSAAVLADASIDNMHDHIDLVAPLPEGRDSVAVVMRVRNSLLNTVLFYDMMLGSAGAAALDWLGTDLQRIGPAVELGQWYASRFGMWVSIEENGAYREVARIPDTGPIAWNDVAVLVPVPADGDSLRVRLSFVMDEWRIDRASLALAARRGDPRPVPISQVKDADGTDIPDALHRLAEPDEQYVETGPGHYFTAHFDAGPKPAAGTRTFLLSSLGYYTEWVRPDWIRGAPDRAPFRPTDATLLAALERWQAVKPQFESRFYETRIPVRQP